MNYTNEQFKRKATPSSRVAGFVNRKRFTKNLRLPLMRIERDLSRRSVKRVLCASNGRIWTKRTFDRALFATLLDEEICKMFGTSNIFQLLDRLNQGEVLDPIAVNWIDKVLEKHFLRYFNRLDIKRYDNLLFAANYPSSTIEYFFLKARGKYHKDLSSVGYYEECIQSLVTRNPFSLLREEECRCDTVIDIVELCPDHNVVRHLRTRPKQWDDLTQLVTEHTPPSAAPPRSPALLTRLRRIIQQLADIRIGWSSVQDCLTVPEFEMQELDTDVKEANAKDVVAQMMEPTAVSGEQESSVVLTNSEDCKETPAIVEPPETFWAKASTSDALVNNAHASQFEILAKQFTWSDAGTNGSILFEMDLPIDAISANPDHPAAMQFQQYAYWIGSIRARLHVNTTPMHVGKIVMFFYYSAKFDINYRNRFNIANAVQLPHTFYNAASGEDACLDIPFRNFRSFLCTRKRENDTKAFYMGTLVGMIFNSLDTAGDIRSVDGYLHISFHDNQYSGVLRRSVIEAQMLPMAGALKMAESALTLINKANNMDKPIVTPVPAFIQPTLTSSMASGMNDLSTIHHLRLDPHGQTQHPAGSSTMHSETAISTIKKIPGLLAQTAWSTSNSNGFRLWSIPATLAQPEENYFPVRMRIEKQNFRGLVLPPVCFLADMHAFSRGSFSIVVELVNSRFHTGSLLIAYTPAVTTQTFNDAVQSYNMTLDCGSVSRYEFVVPYIAERPLSARYNRFADDPRSDVLSNGVIGLYVMNSLRVTASTSTIAINIFIKGTDETEFMCLTAPNFSVIYDQVNRKFPEIAIVPEARGAIGLGTWRYSNDIIKNMAVLRYGAGSDHVLQFPGMEMFVVYESNFQNDAAKLPEMYAQTIARSGAVSATAVKVGGPQYIVRFVCNGDKDRYYYAAAFPNEASAIRYCDKHFALKTDANPFPDSPKLTDFTDLLEATIICLGFTTSPEPYREYGNNLDLQYVPIHRSKSSKEVVAQMDNPIRSSEENTTHSGRVGIKKLLPLGNGVKLFGESFSDLKDYTRRFDLYGTALVYAQSKNVRIARIPLLTTGLHPSGTTLMNREGLIPYINSNYAFWRGSMQLKIFVDAKTANAVTYYFQHKYDFHTTARTIDVKSIDEKGALLTDTLQNGYAVVAMCPQLNPNITIEVPCYIATNLLLAQRTDPANLVEVVNASLGVLDMFCFNTVTATVTIWVALSDDFEYSCYIGVPPVVPINNILPDAVGRVFLRNSWEFIEEIATGKDVVPQMPVGKKVVFDGVLRDYSSLTVKELQILEQAHMAEIQASLDALDKDMNSVIESPFDNLYEETEKDNIEVEPNAGCSKDAINEDKAEDEDRDVLAPDDIDVLEEYDADDTSTEKQSKIACATRDFISRLRAKLRNLYENKKHDTIRRELDLEPNEDDMDSYSSIFCDLIKKVSSEYKHVIISILGQIAHYIANPCAMTAAITLTTLLAHLGFETGIFDTVASKVCKLFGRDQAVIANAGENESEESPKLIKMNFVRAIVAACASKIGASIEVIKSIPYMDFSKGIWSNVRFGALTFNTLIIMVKNIVEYVPKIFEWLAKKINPVNWYRYLFKKDKTLIDKWIVDVDYMLDPNNAPKIHTDPRMAIHLQFLVLIGKELAIKMSRMTSRTSNEYQSVRHKNIELNKLYTELVMSNSACGIVRAEPYCFCVHGDSQVGKTHLATLVAENALMQTGWQGYTLPTYTRQPGAPYWTGLLGQLICVIEDWLQFEESDRAFDDVYDVIHLVSRQVFQPPQAEISKKYIRFAPVIVVLTMNKGFKRIKGVADNNAWMNRRHDLFHFINKQKCSPKDMPKDVQDNRSFLTVKKHTYTAYKPPGHTEEIQNVENLYDKLKVPKFTINGDMVLLDNKIVYEEVEDMSFWQFQWYVAEKFQVEYKRIIRQYQEALLHLTKFWPQDDSSLTSKFESYIKDINMHSPTLHENDIKLLKTIADAKNKRMCSFCHHYEAQCTCKDLAILQSKLAKGVLEDLRKKDVQAQMGAKEFLKEFVKQGSDTQVEKQMSFSEKIRTFIHCLTANQRNYYGTIYVQAAKCVFTNKDWKNEIVDLYNSCPHGAIARTNWQLNNYEFNFEKTYIEYYREKVAFPSKACCGDFYDKAWSILRAVEANQEAEGILNVPLPVISQALYKLDTSFLKGTYKKYEKDFQRFINTQLKPPRWYEKWGKQLFRACSVIGKAAFVMLSVFSVKLFWDKFKDGGTPAVKDQILETIGMENQVRAKRIALHKPTPECLDKCPYNICGNMAYNQNKPVKTIPAIKVVRPEMSTDVRDSLERLIVRNTFFISAITRDGNDGIRYDVRCFGLKGNYFVAIDHYFDQFMALTPDTTFLFVQGDVQIELNYAKLNLRRLEDSCLVIGELPKQVPAFANILPKICSERHGANLPRDGILYELQIGQKNFTVLGKNNLDFTFVSRYQTVPPVGHAVTATQVRNYYQYARGGLGMCGALLVSDSNIVAPIIGIHFAGTRDGTEGYAEVISRETFETILATLPDTPSVALTHVQCNSTDVIIDPQASPVATLTGIFEHVGVVQRPYSHRPPPKSKQEHSECYNEITQSTYDFPLLSPKDPRAVGSPMVTGCLHHCDPPKNFEEDLLSEAAHNVRLKILAHTKPKRMTVGVLTPEEVIVGISQNEFYNPLEFDTSEGFPFTRYRPAGAHDKRWMFDLDENEDGYVLNKIDPMLLEVMEYKQKQREANTIPLTVFTDCLKDIKVPAEKIQPRIFSISPVDFTIQFKQYFSDFMIAYQEARFKVSSAVGINVDSMEWTQLVNLLLKNSPHFGCGDYSKFGPRLMSICVIEAFNIINDWYTLHGNGEANNIRAIMAHEVAFAKHLMFNYVYGVLCGAPSGSPITTILNNIVNDLYINYVWCYVIRNLHTTVSYSMDTICFSYSNFSLFVMLICYGDDLIMTIKEEVLAIFNPIIIKEVLSLYNIKFTDACKTGTQYASLSVFDKAVSFLKRNISAHPHRQNIYIAKMDRRAIEETCNWVHKSTKFREMSIVSCEAMLLNAYGHGKLYYENLRKRVQNYWLLKNEVVTIPSWDEVDFRIFGRDDFMIKRFLW